MMLQPKPSTIQGYASAYTAEPLNWRLCKLRPHSKAPMLAEWNSVARTVGPDAVISVFTNNENGIGLVHEASGTGAFDVDSLEHARTAFAEFGIEIERILAGYPRIAGRGGRDKIVFRLPPGLTTVKLVWPPATPESKPITVFELRANGGQDVLPPSIHPDTGMPYTWIVSPFDFPDGIPMAPEQLQTIWKSWKSFEPQFKSACPWIVKKEQEYKPVPRAVSTEHGNVIGKYNSSNRIGDLLEEFGYKPSGKRWLSPTSSSGIPGVVVLKDSNKCFSHHASDPLNNGFAHDAFSVLVTLRYNGNMNEALRVAAREVGAIRVAAPAMDFSELLASKNKKPTARIDAPREAMPSGLLESSGMIGVFARHTLETATMPQPELAVAAALALCGLALGRKVATASGLRSNLYLIGVAKTGYGKEHARSMIKDALTTARLSDLIGGEEIASGQGLISRVSSNPVVIFQIDEFGLFLQAVQNSQAGAHKAEITTNFIKLFSASSSTYHGTEYADQKGRPRVDIICPCAVLHGTTTPETLFPALGSSHVTSGYLNRMLVVFASEAIPERKKAKWKPQPESLIAWLQAAREMSEGILGLSPDSPIVVDSSYEAESLFDDYQSEVDTRMVAGEKTGTASLWARAAEHARKISMVIELASDLNSRSISGASASLGVQYARWCQSALEREVITRVADSEFMRVVLDSLRVVRSAGPSGRTERELGLFSRAFRALKPMERDAVFTMMIRDGEADWRSLPAPSGKGKARQAMVASEHLESMQNAG